MGYAIPSTWQGTVSTISVGKEDGDPSLVQQGNGGHVEAGPPSPS